jgi:hypothetical protein
MTDATADTTPEQDCLQQIEACQLDLTLLKGLIEDAKELIDTLRDKIKTARAAGQEIAAVTMEIDEPNTSKVKE